MGIHLSTLEAAAIRYPDAYFAKSLNDARSSHQRTAFLCHSHHDRDLARGLQTLFREHECEVYLDWQDAEMPETPDRATAVKIQSKIRELDFFIFLATPRSTASRWCPWEIGYADRAKAHENIFIVETYDNEGNWYGNEYLQLYRQISSTTSGCLHIFEPGQTKSDTPAKSLSRPWM